MTHFMKLSVIILTKNEEKNLEKCLTSVSFADEIIIIDDLSVDNTISIAEKYKAFVFQNNLNGDFSKQRNLALEKAQGEWMLFLDADEELSKDLIEEIKQVATQNNTQESAYYLKRRDYFWNQELKYGETKTAREQGFIRLVKKNSGLWQGSIHETFKPTGCTATLKGFVNHFPHQTIKEFLESVNHYSTLRAKELLKEGKSTSIFEITFFPLGKFFYTYIGKRGFLDGAAGFAYSFFMSFHSFLVRTKLFQYKTIDR